MKKHKVGIVTYHRAINYGAVLQAYALNTKINTLGVPCETIDYQCEAVGDQYNYRSWRKRTSWQNFIAHNLTCFLRRGKKSRFQRFIEKIPLSTQCNRKSIGEVARSYDIFIAGSDQIFNPICHKNDPTYFLDFVTFGTKNCYAASMGSIAQFELSNIDVKKLLQGFDKLSFREQEAAEYTEKLINRKCFAVMDPVWFLNKKEWGKLISAPRKKPYIYVYNLMDYDYMREYVKKLSQKTKLPVVVTNRTVIGDLKYFGIASNQSNCSPEEFLGYIKNAEYIVTDSFHGTSVAMMFEKQFCVALNPAQNNTNSRLNTILNLTELQRKIINIDTLMCDLKLIDYGFVNSRLKSIIEESEMFLKSIIFD